MDKQNLHNLCLGKIDLLLKNFVIAIVCMVFCAILPHNAHAQTFTADWSDLGIPSLNSVDSGTTLTEGPRTITITHTEITEWWSIWTWFR